MIFRRYLREDDRHYFLNEDGTLNFDRIENALSRFTLGGHSITSIATGAGVTLSYLREGSNVSPSSFPGNTAIVNLNPYNLRESLSILLMEGMSSDNLISYVKVSDWILLCEAMLRKEDL